MKKLISIIIVIVFSTSGLAFSKSNEKGKYKEKSKIEEKSKERSKETKKEQDKGIDSDKAKPEGNKDIPTVDNQKKNKEKGKKTEPPAGVQKAAEKGKGEKKGLLKRWFGGSKDDKGQIGGYGKIYFLMHFGDQNSALFQPG